MIQYIKITYVTRPSSFLWGCYYDICFDIRTKDNSEFHLKVLEMGKQRKDFIEAVNLLKEHNVSFIDQYDIISHLENSPQSISFYLEKIEKGKEEKNDLYLYEFKTRVKIKKYSIRSIV